MVHSIVHLVQPWVLDVLARNIWYGVVLGYTCVTKSARQLAYMSVSVIHVYGTSMDGPLDRWPCTRLGTGRFCTKYVVRGCTRLHLGDQNTSPAGIHECECDTCVRNDYGWSNRSFTLYNVGLWPIWHEICRTGLYWVTFVRPKHPTSLHACLQVSYICTEQVWMSQLIVYLVQGWVMTVLPRNMWYGVVLGYICVTKSPQQLACMFVKVIYMYGTSMDDPLDRLPCTRLVYILFTAK